jgi:hypothetical protein
MYRNIRASTTLHAQSVSVETDCFAVLTVHFSAACAETPVNNETVADAKTMDKRRDLMRIARLLGTR